MWSAKTVFGSPSPSPLPRGEGRGEGGRSKLRRDELHVVTRVPNRPKIAEKVRVSCNSSLRTQGFETISEGERYRKITCPMKTKMERRIEFWARPHPYP